MSTSPPDTAVFHRVEVRCREVGIPIGAVGIAAIDRYLAEERASDCKADGLGRGEQGVAVHAEGMRHVG